VGSVLRQRLWDVLILSKAQGALSGGGYQREAAVLAAARALLFAVGPHVLRPHVQELRSTWPLTGATADGTIAYELPMLSA
jgi:hypothetical protein